MSETGREYFDRVGALTPRDCVIHITPLDDSLTPELLDDYATLLTAEEAARWKRYRFERNRREYLVTRALVRVALAEHAGVSPTSLSFGVGAWGKPYVTGPAEAVRLSFNVSNTDGMVVCIVALDRDVGIDVERIDRPANTVGVADRYFAPSEVESLRALPERDQIERFFSYWTLKEAYIKARGMGLALPLDKHAFDLDTEDAPTIRFEPPIDDSEASWQLSLAGVSPVHRIAWMIRRTGEDLRVTVTRDVPRLPRAG